jgi:hypothetical protein
LPVPYFHLVFTLPAPIAEIAFQNKAVVYAILFKAAADAMMALAANPRKLGARIGGLAVLYLSRPDPSPHVHCVVPGGLSSTERDGRGAAELSHMKPLSGCSGPCFERCRRHRVRSDSPKLTRLAGRGLHRPCPLRRSLVVCAQSHSAGWLRFSPISAATLSRHIASSRVISRWRPSPHLKDYRQNGAEKIMRLKPNEFIRRFLLHTLPDGLHRIRYFGFMANGHRAEKIASCRALLVDEEAKPQTATLTPDPAGEGINDAKRVCPDCGGAMRIIERMFPAPSRRHAPTFRCDTS